MPKKYTKINGELEMEAKLLRDFLCLTGRRSNYTSNMR